MSGQPQESPKRGQHEVETTVSMCELGGPLSSFAGCRKKISDPTHHDKFFYVDDFGTKHLPESMSGVPDEVKDCLVSYIKARAQIVFRISGGTVSYDRPDFWEDGTKYHLSEFKGKEMNKVGSGWLMQVHETVCSASWGCGQSADGGGEDKACWKIWVQTARHVIFDTSEANTCRFDFFDDRPDGEGHVSVPGGGAVVWGKDTEGDYCVVEFLTHDPALGQRLQDLWKQCYEVTRDRLYRLIEKHNCDPSTFPVVVISHPHGRAKYVSVGCHIGQEGWLQKTKLYDVPTCPGSSGGMVLDFTALGSGIDYYETQESQQLKTDYKKVLWDVDDQMWQENERVVPGYPYVCQSHAGTKLPLSTAVTSTESMSGRVGYSSHWGHFY